MDNKEKLLVNAFGGLAIGKFSMNDDGQYFRNGITKTYLQGVLNYVPFDYLSLSFIFKTSFVHYRNVQTTYPMEKQQSYHLDELNNRTLVFFEPEINCMIGLPQYPWMRLKFSSSVSLLSGKHSGLFNARKANNSLGLSFDFSKA